MAKIVHNLIAKTAKEMCAAFYEEAAHDNNFYKLHPTMRGFVRVKWQYFIGYARDALTTMLGSDRYSEHMKEEIYEAMVLDGQYKGPPRPAVERLTHGRAVTH